MQCDQGISERQPRDARASTIALSLCAVLAISTLWTYPHAAKAGRTPRVIEGASGWAAAPTAINVVAAAPAVTTPTALVTAFSIMLVAVVVRVVTIEHSRRISLCRFGGLYGP